MPDSVTETVQDQDNNVLEKMKVLQEQNLKLMEQMELEKKQRSSLDAKVSEYQQQLKEKELTLETIKTNKLSETEKMQMEMEKIKLDFQNERNSRTKAENRSKALEIMSENGIDKRYIDFIPLDDGEAMIERLNGLSLIAKDTMQEGARSVVNKLGGNVPAGGNIPAGKITRQQYKALSPSERDKAFKEGRIIGIGS